MTVHELQTAIRNKCLDCVYQQPKEVRLCPSVSCANWPYRMGRHHPKQEPGRAEIVQVRSPGSPETDTTEETEALG